MAYPAYTNSGAREDRNGPTIAGWASPAPSNTATMEDVNREMDIDQDRQKQADDSDAKDYSDTTMKGIDKHSERAQANTTEQSDDAESDEEGDSQSFVDASEHFGEAMDTADDHFDHTNVPASEGATDSKDNIDDKTDAANSEVGEDPEGTKETASDHSGSGDDADGAEAQASNAGNNNVIMVDSDDEDNGHGYYCHGEPGAETPPEPQSPRTSQEPDTPPAMTKVEKPLPPSTSSSSSSPADSPTPSQLDADKAKKPKAVRDHELLHNKAKNLRPNSTLGQNRYWIGVISLGMQPKDVRKAGDFVWIKGNGGTTVKTIWHTYQMQAGIIDKFDLLMQGNPRKETDIMRDLDLYDDRFVVFRAVPKVIEID